MSRIGDQRSPFGVTPSKVGNRSRFRLKLGPMRRIGGIRRANFLEPCSGPRRGLRDKNAANGACRVYHSLCGSGGAKDRSRQLLYAQLATGLPLTPEEQELALGWLSDLAVFPCRCRKSKLSPRVMHASRSLLCMRREDVQFLGAGRHPRITIARAPVTTVPSPTELRGMGRGEGLPESSR